MGKTIGLALGSGLALILSYLFFWPVPINPASWTPPDMPPLTGVYQENNQLAVVERFGIGAGKGPEDIAFDSQGFLDSGMAVIYIPTLNTAFGTTPLRFTDWMVAHGLASIVFWGEEIKKLIMRGPGL